MALLATTAGCAGLPSLGDGDTGSDTVTPAPIPEVTTTERQLDPPPGLAPDGIEHAGTLAFTHRRLLQQQSYTFHEQFRRTVETGDGGYTVVRNETTTVVDAGRYRHRLERVRHRPNGTRTTYAAEAFAGGGRWYDRSDPGDGPASYDSGELVAETDQFAAESEFYLDRYVTVTESRVELVRWRGRPFYRVTGWNGTTPLGQRADRYRVALIVDRRGLVHRFDVSYRTETERLSYSFRYERLGETRVVAPDWVEERRTDRTAG